MATYNTAAYDEQTSAIAHSRGEKQNFSEACIGSKVFVAYPKPYAGALAANDDVNLVTLNYDHFPGLATNHNSGTGAVGGELQIGGGNRGTADDATGSMRQNGNPTRPILSSFAKVERGRCGGFTNDASDELRNSPQGRRPFIRLGDTTATGAGTCLGFTYLYGKVGT